jgi:ribulose 1,5-bisphosphate synthetase/thiazole synthase
VERGFGLPVAGMNSSTILTTENMGKICGVEAHCLVSGKKISVYITACGLYSLLLSVFLQQAL